MKPLKIEFDDGTAYCETCKTALQFLAERCKCLPPPRSAMLSDEEMAEIITRIKERNKCRE